RKLAALRIEDACGDKGAGGGSADAGIAMDDERVRTVPAAHKRDESGDVVIGWGDITVDQLSNVVHAENEVVVGYDRVRTSDKTDILEQRHDVACASNFP